MVSMDGRTRTCDLRIPNAERYQLRHIHIRSYQMCWLHPPITWVGIGISPTPFCSFSYCIIKNVKERGGFVISHTTNVVRVF